MAGTYILKPTQTETALEALHVVVSVPFRYRVGRHVSQVSVPRQANMSAHRSHPSQTYHTLVPQSEAGQARELSKGIWILHPKKEPNHPQLSLFSSWQHQLAPQQCGAAIKNCQYTCTAYFKSFRQIVIPISLRALAHTHSHTKFQVHDKGTYRDSFGKCNHFMQLCKGN